MPYKHSIQQFNYELDYYLTDKGDINDVYDFGYNLIGVYVLLIRLIVT